jgi:flavin-dependent dehydrogenase
LSDVIVVGAGISGLRCAELLANAGLDVLVLEKKKTIGGSFGENLEAFPEYHYSKLDLPVPYTPVTEVQIFCGEGFARRRLRLQFNGPVFRIVKRGSSVDSIDSYLYQRVRKTTAQVLFNERFEYASQGREGKITVRSSGGDYKCKVLIAADGVFSAVRKSLRMSGRQKPEGVGYIAKVEGAKLEHSETIGIFNYKRWPGSYCYLIGYPHENYSTVGMTLRPNRANTLVKKYFDSLIDYLPEILGEARIVDLTRGFVTMGSRDRPLSASLDASGIPNVLFVGEAGGFQDPTLAFGLAPALASANLASSSVIRALMQKDFRLLDEYQTRARRELVKDETRRISFRYILESMTEGELSTFLSTIAEHPQTVERVMRTGDYVRNFLPLVIRSASRNPKMMSFPFRFVKTSRSLRSGKAISRRT